MTWLRESNDAYRVFFNRDELKTRSIAEPPRVVDTPAANLLAPKDPDGGGTWMLVNRHGLTLALLNRWHEKIASTPKRSRGLLLLDMAKACSVHELTGLLDSTNLHDYAPFTIVAIDHTEQQRFDWDGSLFAQTEAMLPITSSSFQFEDVRSARHESFAELGEELTPETLREYHFPENAECSAYTVKMCRADAQTWSFSEVWVERKSVKWRYLACNPEHNGSPPQYFEVFLLGE